jgi:hypothetical protein
MSFKFTNPKLYFALKKKRKLIMKLDHISDILDFGKRPDNKKSKILARISELQSRIDSLNTAVDKHSPW